MKIATLNVKNCAFGAVPVANCISGLDADVVFLQEVDRYAIRSRFRNQVTNLRKRCRFPYSHFEATLDLAPKAVGRYGIGVLSRFPATFRRIDLSIPGDREPRVAIELIPVMPDDRPALNMYGTHLSVNDMHARAQLRMLHAEASTSGKRWVIAGDFNLTSLEVLETLGRDGREDSADPTFPAQAPLSRIDHILASREALGSLREGASRPCSLSTVTFGNAGVSDHLGLLGTLR